MTLRHGNRVRKSGGEQMIRELERADAIKLADHDPTDDEIRRRAYDIYTSRNGAPGSAEMDWLRAEVELRAQRARVSPE